MKSITILTDYKGSDGNTLTQRSQAFKHVPKHKKRRNVGKKFWGVIFFA